jgi:hypothetical protein
MYGRFFTCTVKEMNNTMRMVASWNEGLPRNINEAKAMPNFRASTASIQKKYSGL